MSDSNEPSRSCRLRPILRVRTVRGIRLRRIRKSEPEPQPEPEPEPKCQWGRRRIPERGRRPVQGGGTVAVGGRAAARRGAGNGVRAPGHRTRRWSEQGRHDRLRTDRDRAHRSHRRRRRSIATPRAARRRPRSAPTAVGPAPSVRSRAWSPVWWSAWCWWRRASAGRRRCLGRHRRRAVAVVVAVGPGRRGALARWQPERRVGAPPAAQSGRRALRHHGPAPADHLRGGEPGPQRHGRRAGPGLGHAGGDLGPRPFPHPGRAGRGAGPRAGPHQAPRHGRGRAGGDGRPAMGHWSVARPRASDRVHSLVGRGREFSADQRAAGVVRYPPGIGSALDAMVEQPAAGASWPPGTGRTAALTRWLWIDPTVGPQPAGRWRATSTTPGSGPPPCPCAERSLR